MKKEIIEQEGMPTIIKLKVNNDQNDLVNALEAVLEMAKSGTMKNFVLVGTDKEDRMISARSNVSVLEQQQFTSFMQTECTIRTIMECAPVYKPL
jgi:uncharacterized protein